MLRGLEVTQVREIRNEVTGADLKQEQLRHLGTSPLRRISYDTTIVYFLPLVLRKPAYHCCPTDTKSQQILCLSLLGHLQPGPCLQRRGFGSCHANPEWSLKGSTTRPGFRKTVLFPCKIFGIARPFFILGTVLRAVEIRGRMAGQPLEGSLYSRKGRGHGSKDNSMASAQMAEARVPSYKDCTLPMA